jgi:hypothetical protein
MVKGLDNPTVRALADKIVGEDMQALLDKDKRAALAKLGGCLVDHLISVGVPTTNIVADLGNRLGQRISERRRHSIGDGQLADQLLVGRDPFDGGAALRPGESLPERQRPGYPLPLRDADPISEVAMGPLPIVQPEQMAGPGAQERAASLPLLDADPFSEVGVGKLPVKSDE